MLPHDVLLVRHAPGPRRSVPVLPDETFSHQRCAIFHARQTEAQVVGRLHRSTSLGTEFVSMNALKKASPDRIKELLRIMNLLASLFGSQETCCSSTG